MTVESEDLYGLTVTRSRGQAVAHVARADVVKTLRTLRDQHGFAMCLDVCGVDHLTYRAPRELPEGVEPERFEVVYLLISHTSGERLRVRVQVPESDPTCPSVFEVHPGTEAPERETYDLMGIVFTGHPDLTRILMPEDWEGHPLRKDYAIGRIPVQFKHATNAR